MAKISGGGRNMDEFWNRHHLGDRWLAAVGALMAAAAISLVGIAILVAHRVDTESAAREVETVRAGLGSVASRVQKDLRAFSRWDESAPQSVPESEVAWIHHHYGRRLHETGGYDQSYILNGNGVPVYASIGGRLVDKNIYELAREKIAPLVDEVRDAYKQRKLNAIIRQDDAGGVSASEPVSAWCSGGSISVRRLSAPSRWRRTTAVSATVNRRRSPSASPSSKMRSFPICRKIIPSTD